MSGTLAVWTHSWRERKFMSIAGLLFALIQHPGPWSGYPNPPPRYRLLFGFQSFSRCAASFVSLYISLYSFYFILKYFIFICLAFFILLSVVKCTL